MSEPNNKPLSEEKKSSDIVDIDETGKVKIKDEELAQINDELTPEDLEDIAGGCNDGCVNASCLDALDAFQ